MLNWQLLQKQTSLAEQLQTWSDEEVEELLRDWSFWARTNQLPPSGDWFVWLIMAGRGWGKTRSGAEWTADKGRDYPGARIALVGATFADARDTMVEGESGLLSVLGEGELRGGTVDKAWNRSLGELFLANGTKFKIYSSEKPRQLRGPQHHFAWGDEPAYWNDADKGTAKDTTWSNLKIGTRLPRKGSWNEMFKTQICLTTTPRMVKLLLNKTDTEHPGLTQDKLTVVTRGKTNDNLRNLAETYRQTVVDPLVGTRLGRQELDGELIEDVEGALWKYSNIGPKRVRTTPDLIRIVTSIDPAVTSNEDSDETGIVVAGTGWCICKGKTQPELHGFVLQDLSDRYTPNEWARLALRAHHNQEGDRIIAEVNNGGDLVRVNLQTVEKSFPYKAIHASRGKQSRAEPVAALYEQGKVHHLGSYPELEDEMTTWIPGHGDSPNRVDALVWAMTELLCNGQGMKLH